MSIVKSELTKLADSVRKFTGTKEKLSVPGMASLLDGLDPVKKGMDFYKCASVDTTAKTWTGYLAVLEDGAYSFETNVTEGLTFGGGFTPVVGNVYDAEALMSCNLYLGGYQWIRFQINNIRNGYGYAQAAEFVLFDASGNEISCSELGLVKTSSNTTQVGGGSIASMFDGVKNDLYNVWCFEFFAGGYTEGEFRSKINLAKYPSYGWYTAGDLPERDPVSWSVYVSRNGTDWEMVSNISEYPTTNRFALAGKWSFDKVD